MTDNNTLYVARLHLILFFWPGFLFCFAVFLSQKYTQLGMLSLVLAVIALIWGGVVFLIYHFSSLTINKTQVILQTGVLVRNTMNIAVNKIESIDIRQTLLGTLFCYGTVVITGTGGSRQLINYLNKPLTCRRYIEQLMNA